MTNDSFSIVSALVLCVIRSGRNENLNSFLIYIVVYDKWSSVHYTVDDLDKTYAALKVNGLHKKFTHVITGMSIHSYVDLQTPSDLHDIDICIY